MNYFAILGRIPELSLLELKHVLTTREAPFSSLTASREIALFESLNTLDSKRLLSCLGGTIKLGTYNPLPVASSLSDDTALIPHFIEKILELAKNKAERITFGFSAYTLTQRPISGKGAQALCRNLNSLGLSIKKELRSQGYSIRFVAPQKNSCILSSVVTTKEKLLEQNGCEFALVMTDAGLCVGQTTAVQEFEEYSFRDWQRPARSMDVGLLPPKLAKIMLNLTDTNPKATHVLDPFCGFGTILQEALLLGYKQVSGSDISKQNVEATQKNLSWLAEKKGLSLSGVRVSVQDAIRLSQSHKPASIDAIITEPYLGPIVTQRGTKQLASILKELEKLYLGFFKEARSILKKDGSIVIVLPFWIDGNKKTLVPFLQKILSLGFKVTTDTKSLPSFGNISTRDSILISRPGQHVGRELFVFTKT